METPNRWRGLVAALVLTGLAACGGGGGDDEEPTPVTDVAPRFTTQPASQAVAVGSTVTFTVAASGTPAPTYQWQMSSDGGTTWTDAAGETATTLSGTAELEDNGLQMRATASNRAGTATSAAATLTVTGAAAVAPTISGQPGNVSVTEGQSASFTVAFTGTPTPTVQWQRKPDGGTWSDVAGATSATYSFMPLVADNGMQVQAVVSNSAGTATSDPGTLFVTAAVAAPAITVQPLNFTAFAGDAAQFVAAASGSPQPALQWQSSSDGSNWENLSGKTSGTLAITTTTLGDHGKQYRLQASNSEGSVNSNAATLSVTPPTPRFAYGVNFNDDTISSFVVDAASGQLRHTGYALTGSKPHDSVVSPDGKHVYVAHYSSASNPISHFKAGTDGRLQLAENLAHSCGITCQTRTLAMSASGKFIFVPLNAPNQILALAVNPDTGALSEIESEMISQPMAVVVAPGDVYAYAINWDGLVHAYRIESTGALTTIDSDGSSTGAQSNVATGGAGGHHLAITPNGKWLYAANFNSGTVSIFAVASDGSLILQDANSSIDGQQNVSARAGTRHLAIDPYGQYLYAANYDDGSINAWTINDSTGVLSTNGFAFIAGFNYPTHVDVDASGQFLYVANSGSDVISTYQLNSGVPDFQGDIEGRDGVQGVSMASGRNAVVQHTKWALTANYSHNKVASFSVSSSGALTAVTGSPFSTGSTPHAVAADPRGRFVFVANSASHSLSVFSLNGSTGALTEISGSPYAVGTQPEHVVVDSSARFVYVANYLSSNISAFSINQTTGALTAIPGSPFAGALNNKVLSLSPAGKYLYSAGYNASSISKYAIDPVNGALGNGAHYATQNLQSAMAVTPQGVHLFAASEGADRVYKWGITSSNGALSGGLSDITGNDPTALAFHPSGKLFFASNFYGTNVSIFQFTPRNGSFTALGTSDAIASARLQSLAVDSNGSFVLVPDWSWDKVYTYGIDIANGLLLKTGEIANAGGPFAITTVGIIE